MHVKPKINKYRAGGGVVFHPLLNTKIVPFSIMRRKVTILRQQNNNKKCYPAMQKTL